MARLSLHRERSRLKATRALAPDPSDSERQSHFARYYCILVCGFLETCAKLILQDFANKHSRPEIASFVENRLSRFSDVGSQGLSKHTHALKREWGEKLDAFLKDGEAPGDALDSLRNIRNQIAHGGNTGISLGQMDAYYKQVDKVIDFLDDLFQ